jgi:hypothetical protein
MRLYSLDRTNTNFAFDVSKVLVVLKIEFEVFES